MRIMPARSQKMPVSVVVDLDAIVSNPIAFRWKGRAHEIRPITVKEYFNFTNAKIDFDQTISSDKSLGWESLAIKYYQIISSVCDSITVEDIKDMQHAQVAALYQLVLDKILGISDPEYDPETGEVKKKSRTRLPIYETSESDQSSQRPAYSSDGQSSKSWSQRLSHFFKS